MKHKYQQKHLHILAAVGLALLGVMGHLYTWGPLQALDAGSCRTTYMYPSYARIKSFDETHTRYALKYSLYLYREQGKDPVPQDGNGFTLLNGVPALFIPGNAGSYRQVRSIAAECSNLYFAEEASVIQNPKKLNFDFFSADFNEDFTAFHGRTLLDQSEYLNHAVKFILLLYAERSNPPTSVVVLAHSMGGIVARVMLTLDSYMPDSINTIVTLASPHSASPLTFDGDILKVYLAADRFWFDGFNVNLLNEEAKRRLQDVALISITGGALDSVLPADYTTLGFLVPPSNGFTVYTSGIPEVWTAMDHLAIVWCNQLRRRVLMALMETVNASAPERTYPLQTRMQIFSEILFSGFENSPHILTLPLADRVNFKIDVRDSVIHSELEFIWRSDDPKSLGKSFVLLPVSVNSTVLLINDQLLQPNLPADLGDYLGIFLCKSGQNGLQTLDFTNLNTAQFMQLSCVNVAKDLKQIPRSTPDVHYAADSSFGGDTMPFQALQYSGDDLAEFESILIALSPNSGFIILQTGEARMAYAKMSGDMFSLIRNGAELSVLASRPLALNINVPGAWSSILAYKVRIRQQSGKLFSPFIRQWTEDPYETKWIVNVKESSELLISMHGIAPFTPFSRNKSAHGLNLELWSDPGKSTSNVAAVEVILSIDWYNSLKLLVLRYRIAVVSFGFAVAITALLFQILLYHQSGKFLGFLYGLSCITEPNFLFSAVVVLSLLTPITKLRSVQFLLSLIDPVVLQDRNEISLSPNENYKLNLFFLGLEENSLFFAGPLFLVISIGINFLLYHAVVIVSVTFIFIGQLFVSIMRRNSAAANSSSKKARGGVKRKFAVTVIVLAMVLFYLPYQFTYTLSFLIQIFNCMRNLWNKALASLWNFNVTMLMVMLWVLPINVPVLVVFMHNMALRWTTPFSSHHNFLEVAPILVLVEMLSFYTECCPFGKYSPSDTPVPLDRSSYKATVALLVYAIGYSLIYGARHTYWLHHLFNFWCGWLIILFTNHIMVTQLLNHH
ncbi:PGAP1-domain-containing protein [Metschnikowia bicuspidata]|uniref:GPI inositol-deacylase n=1 Tax=Metschnikowia bicuspidata TaxID=27322 RepID=A0A4P9ZFP7_9ASCO|nr:PGAP1-domain-containing protein [Metschnikowia bicuspidata]